MKRGFVNISAVALTAFASTSAVAQSSNDDVSRLYISASGMWVEQDDADFHVEDLSVFDDTEISFDEGFGVAVAIGQDLANSPFRLEFEYAYRQAESESISGPLFDDESTDLDIETQSFMLNGLIDFKLGDGPIGVYAGAGVGVALTRLDIRNLAGVDVNWSNTGTSFAYQGLAGVTFELSETAEVFGGVRYFDALESEIVDTDVENNSINFEVGMRFFF